MKHSLHICAMVAILCLIGNRNPSNATETTSDRTDPNEERCQVEEIRTRGEFLAIASSTEENRDMLFKVTDMPDYYEHFAGNENFCSVYHHGPDCEAIRFVKIFGGAKKGSVVTMAYNKRTGDILRTHKISKHVPGTIATAEQEVTKMERIDFNSKITNVTIPEIVLKQYDSKIKLVAVAPHGKWYILRNCSGKVTWVKLILPIEKPTNWKSLRKWKNVVLEYGKAIQFELTESSEKWDEMLDRFEKEIDDKLRELKVDLSTMKRVSVTLPFESPLPEYVLRFKRTK